MYKMNKYLNRILKLPIEYYIVFFLFVVVIFLSIYGNSAVYTNYQNAKTLNMYNFENFETQFTEPTHGASNVDGQESPILEETKGVLGVFEADGLKASAIDAPPMYDPVSKLKGNPNCTGSANGLSNSLGGLCLTDEVKSLFASRGSINE